MIFDAIFKAIGQIGDARFNRVLLLGVGLSVALLIAVTWIFATAVGWLVGDSVTIWGLGEITWLDTVLSWGSVFVMLGLSVFLMVPVASAITSMFLDQVADAVEDRHYPHLPPPEKVSITDGLTDTISFLGVLIVANLLALILYVMFIPLAPFIFWALNGFLLGREYFTLVAMRRLGRAGANQMRRRHGATIWLAGTLMAVPLSVPLLNLLVPIIGAATFTHLFHALHRGGSAS